MRFDSLLHQISSPNSFKARYKPWPELFGMSWNLVLENYSKLKPNDLPEGILKSSDEQTMTIFDGYEKSKYHFLTLPRNPFITATGKSITTNDLSSLISLLKSSNALEVLQSLEKAGLKIKKGIEKEMMESEGWIGPVQLGFHGAESMKHVHLHVMSLDLISPKLKNKKHYNSFNPALNFFIPISKIIKELKESGTFRLSSNSHYEALLKGPLISFYNGEEFKTIPKLKIHLEEEWNKLARKTKREMVGMKSRKKEEGSRQVELERKKREGSKELESENLKKVKV